MLVLQSQTNVHQQQTPTPPPQQQINVLQPNPFFQPTGSNQLWNQQQQQAQTQSNLIQQQQQLQSHSQQQAVIVSQYAQPNQSDSRINLAQQNQLSNAPTQPFTMGQQQNQHGGNVASAKQQAMPLPLPIKNEVIVKEEYPTQVFDAEPVHQISVQQPAVQGVQPLPVQPMIQLPPGFQQHFVQQLANQEPHVKHMSIQPNVVHTPVVQQKVVQPSVVQHNVHQSPIVQQTGVPLPVVQENVAQTPIVQQNVVNQPATPKPVFHQQVPVVVPANQEPQNSQKIHTPQSVHNQADSMTPVQPQQPQPQPSPSMPDKMQLTNVSQAKQSSLHTNNALNQHQTPKPMPMPINNMDPTVGNTVIMDNTSQSQQTPKMAPRNNEFLNRNLDGRGGPSPAQASDAPPEPKLAATMQHRTATITLASPQTANSNTKMMAVTNATVTGVNASPIQSRPSTGIPRTLFENHQHVQQSPIPARVATLSAAMSGPVANVSNAIAVPKKKVLVPVVKSHRLKANEIAAMERSITEFTEKQAQIARKFGLIADNASSELPDIVDMFSKMKALGECRILDRFIGIASYIILFY